MGKLIDSDTTKKALKECGLWNADYEAEISCDIIDDQPAVDAVPVVHAHWIYKFTENGKYDHFKCSRCGKVNRTVAGTRSKYCGECGARMDEVEDE